MDARDNAKLDLLNRREMLGLVGGAAVASALTPLAWGAEPTPPATPAAEPFRLPPLPYPFEALEPVIDAETMRLHHGKHHAGYVANLNAAIERAPELKGRPVEALLADLDQVPESVRTAVRNHGGGHANHSLFWQCLAPGGAPLSGPLAEAIVAAFGSVESFKEAFTRTAMGVFGSGWAWLVLDRGKLAITATANQDSPVSQGQVPLFGVDVWEHAYYLKYQNRRGEYLNALWQVANWPFVASRLAAARA